MRDVIVPRARRRRAAARASASSSASTRSRCSTASSRRSSGVIANLEQQDRLPRAEAAAADREGTIAKQRARTARGGRQVIAARRPHHHAARQLARDRARCSRSAARRSLIVLLARAAAPARRGHAGRLRASPSLGVITAGALLVLAVARRPATTAPITHHRRHGARRRRSRVFLGIVVVVATALALLLSVAYLAPRGLEAPEYVALMLFSAPGMLAMTTANDLIVVFLALEILSIPLYVLAAFDRRRLSSQEAGIKYFVLGAFSSAIFLYGIALVYGAHRHHVAHRDRHVPARRTRCSSRARCSPGSCCCSSASGSRSRRCRSTCGRPTCTRARRRRSPRSWRRPPRPPAFAALLRVFDVAFPHVPRPTGARSSGRSPCSRSLVGSIGALRPDRPQADARLLVDRARRLRPHRRSRPARREGREAALFYLFVYTFMVDRRRSRWSPCSACRATTTTRSTTTAASRSRRPVLGGAARASSCSPRPASRSPAGSSPSSRCSRPRPTRASTCCSSSARSPP